MSFSQQAIVVPKVAFYCSTMMPAKNNFWNQKSKLVCAIPTNPTGHKIRPIFPKHPRHSYVIQKRTEMN